MHLDMWPVQALSDARLAYVRHARRETLRAINGNLAPEYSEPLSHGMYAFAVPSPGAAPVAMAEASFLQPAFPTYADLPGCEAFDLEAYCPIEAMARLRTVFVEPAYRKTHALFFQLCLSMAHVFHGLGARYSLCTTSAANTELAALYTKLGNRKLGEFTVEAYSVEPVALFILDLEAFLQHRARDRVVRNLEVHPYSQQRAA